MATFLDIGFVEYLMPAIVFLLIFLLLYAFLQKAGFLGGKKAIDISVSLIIALVVMFAGGAVELIRVLTIWYVVMFVVVILLVFFLSAFGMKEGDAFKSIGGPILVLVLGIIFLIFAISDVFGPVFQPYDEDSEGRTMDEGTFMGSFLRSLFHPRVLGAFLILLIVGLTVKRVHG